MQVIEQTKINADLVTVREFRGEKISGFGLETTLNNDLITNEDGDKIFSLSATKYVSLLNEKQEIKKGGDDLGPELKYHSRTGNLKCNLENISQLSFLADKDINIELGIKTYNDYPDVGNGTEGVVGGAKSVADNFLGFDGKITDLKRNSLNSNRDALTVSANFLIPFIKENMGIHFETRKDFGANGRRLELSLGKYLKFGLLNGDKIALSDIQIQGPGEDDDEDDVLKGHKFFLNLRDSPKAGVVLKRNIMTTVGYQREGDLQY